MSSIKPIRDPKTDHLLTPENSALLVIDYQPIQFIPLLLWTDRNWWKIYLMYAGF